MIDLAAFRKQSWVPLALLAFGFLTAIPSVEARPPDAELTRQILGEDTDESDFLWGGFLILDWLERNPGTRLSRSVNLKRFRVALFTTRLVAVDHELTLDGISKDAINYPRKSPARIEFQRTRWRALRSNFKRARFAFHEYLGIIRAENQAYQLSASLFNSASLDPIESTGKTSLLDVYSWAELSAFRIRAESGISGKELRSSGIFRDPGAGLFSDSDIAAFFSPGGIGPAVLPRISRQFQMEARIASSPGHPQSKEALHLLRIAQRLYFFTPLYREKNFDRSHPFRAFNSLFRNCLDKDQARNLLLKLKAYFADGELDDIPDCD